MRFPIGVCGAFYKWDRRNEREPPPPGTEPEEPDVAHNQEETDNRGANELGHHGNIETAFEKADTEDKYCDKCGGHLMTNHPSLGLVDVYAATLPTLKFSPAVHVNYAETVLPMRDGLPKFKDFPAEFGGSGETIAE